MQLQMFNINFADDGIRTADLPMEPEATALPTESQPLPIGSFISLTRYDYNLIIRQWSNIIFKVESVMEIILLANTNPQMPF